MIDKSIMPLCKDVARLIDKHGEAATLGGGLLAIKKAGSGRGLAKLAIVSDFARVCDLVVRSATPSPMVHGSPAFPVIQRAANRLARSGRKEYRQFSQLAPGDLNRFLTVYRKDAGWFGIACVETAWSGLDICRKCSDLDSDTDALQRYAGIATGLIGALLGSSDRPLAVRSFAMFLDETLVEANQNTQCDQRIQGTRNPLVLATINEDDGNAKEISVEWAGTKRNVRITHEPISVPTVFDVHESPEMISIVLNTMHPLSSDLFATVNESNGRSNGHASSTAVRVLLEAWARLENLSGEKRRQLLEDIRLDWGRIARDILSGEPPDKQ